jgi:hypothetical protein
VDWAEDDHDVTVMDPDGRMLAHDRVPEGIKGVSRLHALVSEHADEPGEVVVGIETDRGLLVGSLVAAGYQVRLTRFGGRLSGTAEVGVSVPLPFVLCR